ncbi:MAG TPA: hypothetical protein DCR23_04045 [Ruminococcaceae bacterium]|nr:hypothetical protein [Oscillospiraceae bacterium]
MSKVMDAPETKAEVKKPKKKGRAKKVLCIILVLLVLFIGVTTLITVIGVQSGLKRAKSYKPVEYDQALPEFENYDNGCWKIFADRDIKVLQLTDVHLGGGWMSIRKDAMSMNAVAALVTAEKPDFVVVTGDISYPVPFQAGTFNNKSGAKLFATLMESLGVYWTVCYGNHDTEAYSYYSREELTEFYSSGEFPHCLVQSGPSDVDGEGNQVFNVINSDNLVTRSLVLLDSHSYVDGDYFGIFWKYDNIHENQVEWYRSVIEEATENNRSLIADMDAEKQAQYEGLKTVKSTAFMHIPLTEFRDAWNEFTENGYKETENVKYNYGTIGESGKFIYCGIHEDSLFETMEELGSTDSVFCGHDHLNNLSLNYKGINLSYGMSIDYLAYSGIYKLGAQRGCCVLDIAKDGTLNAHNENYYQEKYLSQYAKEEVTMQVLNENMQ